MKVLIAVVSKCLGVLAKESQKGSQINCNYCDDYYGDRTCHIHRTYE
ncbi:hypothetical protein [Marinomonas sp.]